jgi:hypothetical protein
MTNERAPHPRLPVVRRILLPLALGFLCCLMALAALCGLICLIVGGLSLFVDLSGILSMELGGETVRTTAQKAAFMGLGAAMVCLGSGFLWQYRRDSPGGALLCFVGLLVLLGAISLVTGSANILSLGGPAR